MFDWFKNRRHESWYSDTTITAILFVAVLIATVVTDWLNGPTEAAPSYLTGLLGASGFVLFGAAGSDKTKRDADTKDTANRAEAKVDKLTEVAESQHPGSTEHVSDPPLEGGVM